MFRSTSVAQRLSDSELLHVLSDDDRCKLKKCLLEIYRDFARVCDKHSLRYMLGGGSALGAVRHQGFIPWDDDLDILMPRDDYDRFINIFEEELSDEYVLYAPNSKYGSTNAFAKLVKKGTKLIGIFNISAPVYNGVSVDIFPIENAPKNRIIRGFKGRIADVLRIICVSSYMYTFRNDVTERFFSSSVSGKLNYRFRLIIGRCVSFIGFQKLYDFYDKFVQQKKETGMCTVPTGRKYFCGETLQKSVFFPMSTAIFEGETVYVPNDVDRYLKNLYGDYMEIPKVSNRERHFYIDFQI